MRTPEKDIIELTLLNTKMRIRTSEDKNHLSNVVKEYKEMLDTVEKKNENKRSVKNCSYRRSFYYRRTAHKNRRPQTDRRTGKSNFPTTDRNARPNQSMLLIPVPSVFIDAFLLG